MGEDRAVAEARARRGLEVIAGPGLGIELKAPLSTIIAYAEVALDEEATQAEREEIKKIIPAIRYLLNSINDLGDMCRLALGLMQAERESFDLNEAIAAVHERLRGMAAERGVALPFEVNVEPGLGVMIADRERLRQLLFMLGYRAWQYSRPELPQMLRIGLVDGGMLTLEIATSQRFYLSGIEWTLIEELSALLGGAAQLSDETGAMIRLPLEPPRTAVLGDTGEPNGADGRYRRALRLATLHISHEFRTALGAIIGYVDLLTEEEELGEQEQLDMLRKVRLAGRHLLSVINDLIDFGKLELGRLEVQPEQVDLDALMGDVREVVSTQPEAGCCAVEVVPGLGMANTDPTLLRRLALMLWGIAKNAAMPAHPTRLRIARSSDRLTLELSGLPRPHGNYLWRGMSTLTWPLLDGLSALLGGRAKVVGDETQGGVWVEVPSTRKVA